MTKRPLTQHLFAHDELKVLPEGHPVDTAEQTKPRNDQLSVLPLHCDNRKVLSKVTQSKDAGVGHQHWGLGAG